MGLLPTGVSVLTTGSGPSTAAMTVNAVTSVSLDPLLVLVGVRAAGRIRPRIEVEGSFGLSVLTERQLWLSRLFAAPDRPSGDDAAGILAATGPATGNALVDGALTSLECSLHDRLRGDDHVLLLGRVLAIHHGDPDTGPLVFHRGRYTRLGHAPHPARL